MFCASSSFPLLGPASTMTMASSPISRFVGFGDRTTLRYDHDQRRRCSWTGIEKKMTSARNPFPRNRTASASAYPLFLNQLNKDSPRPKYYKEVTKLARQMFAREISIQSKDSELSIAKVLLYIAAEDEAFLAYNRKMDAQSLMNERKSVTDHSDPSVTNQSDQSETDQSDQSETDQSDQSESDQSDPSETDSEELLQVDGKSISEWLSELDTISKEVEVELVSRDIGCHLGQVLEAVNAVLFGLRGFKRTYIALDPKNSYFHSVLTCRCGTAFLLSVIYIEVCQRLEVPIVGSRVGEDFFIWPKLDYPEELFNLTSGKSLFSIVNGSCVDDPASMASDLTAKSLEGLKIATNRDIIEIALANLSRLHWRRATKSAPGLMLTSPVSQVNNISSTNFPLLRPQELGLAIATLQRLLMLRPHRWALRRDLAMMLYYDRQYGEAIQELSIHIAFAPEEELKVLQLFVVKLHLLRLISSLKSPIDSDRLTVP